MLSIGFPREDFARTVSRTAHNILVADIGGTSSRFAHFLIPREDGVPKLHATKWLKTKEAQSFEHLLEKLAESDFPLRLDDADNCVFALAGPIEDGIRSTPPNINWKVDLAQLDSILDIEKDVLINDFLAQAFAAVSPIGDRAEEILPGAKSPNGTIAVLGAGTGLGKAALVRGSDRRLVGCPSEGGHATFPAESAREFELYQFIREKTAKPYAVWDDIVSGKGISLVHEFLTGEKLEPAEVAASFERDNETLEWSSRLFARVCRNFALDVLALGGVFIAGGVAAKNPQILRGPAFAKEFYSSAKHEDVLRGISVQLMDDEESGLWGGAYYALQRISDQEE